VFDVHEDGVAALTLDLGDDGETEGRLAGGLRAEDLDDATAGEAADPEGQVDGDGAGRDGGDRHLGGVAHAHQGAVTVLLVDRREGEVEGLAFGGLNVGFLLGGGFLGGGFGFGGHGRGALVRRNVSNPSPQASKMNKCSLIALTLCSARG
jgi:hypothetical protein